MVNTDMETIRPYNCEQGEAIQVLKVVGQQLDKNIFPVVKNGGLVVPNPMTADQNQSVKVNKNEQPASRRSEARPWKRPERRQWKTYRSWSTYKTAPVVSSHIKELYDQELDSLEFSYPGLTAWQQDEGLWLLTESTILPGCWHKAAFVTGISYMYPFHVRSWGFWISGISMEPVWIGPRHTNFPDGSICAFEPRDRTWCIGQSIVTLLDLYTLWALRHRHLEIFGRWPGQQSVHHAYERILELKEDEFCGCGWSEKKYGDCCQQRDLSQNRVTAAIEFRDITGGMTRKPPNSIIDFIRKRCNLPDLNELLYGVNKT